MSWQDLLPQYVSKTYAGQGVASITSHGRQLELLMQHKRLPKEGWSDSTIELTLLQLALMDSNNFPANVGVGEREGRVFSSLVARRHFQFSHGVGRSGDIVEVQPKAAGSSVLYKLTNLLVGHMLKLAGVTADLECVVFPMATGMTLCMAMIALRTLHPDKKYVLWPRIDQKSCFKSILAAGLVPIVVENVWTEQGMETNMEALEALLVERGHEILCVLSTTSCFAPRQPDMVDRIAKLCKQHGVGHVVNNAYGLQCAVISRLLSRACQVGRVDAIVQSTDKNFLVPVGGAVVASPDRAFLAAISGSYPGRASMAPVLDLFITMLGMGEDGYLRLLQSRRDLVSPKLRVGLEQVLDKYGLTLLPSPRNTISLAVCIDALPCAAKPFSFLGSMLFQRNVSGCRVVVGGEAGARSTLAGHEFVSWGAHHGHFPHSYVTIACAIGMREQEVDVFLARLDKTLAKFVKMNNAAPMG